MDSFQGVRSTLLHTGCRRGEALGMQWRDFDWSNRRIWIRRARVNARTVLPKQRKRGSKPRSVRITAAMERVLGELQEAQRHELRGDVDSWVFRSRMGTAIEETTLFRAWKRIRRLAAAEGVRPLTLHSLRHTFGSVCAARGVPLPHLKELMGHASVSTTMRYVTVTGDQLDAAIQLAFGGAPPSERQLAGNAPAES